MKIIRNNQEIELTDHELFKAYKEYQENLDKQNIIDNLDGVLEDLGLLEKYEKLKEEKSFIDNSSYLLRKYLDDYGSEYSIALKNAIKDTIAEMED